MTQAETSEKSRRIPLLLAVDDDRAFCRMLKRVMERRGLRVVLAHSAEDAYWAAADEIPDYAVVDLRMPGDSGLTLVPRLRALSAEMRIVVLTGYGSVATAVEAIKSGATHYLSKPVKPEEILEAFGRVQGDPDAPIAVEPQPMRRLEWEHIQRVLVENQGNVTEAAKQLGMHRRTLQRKLAKRPVPEK